MLLALSRLLLFLLLLLCDLLVGCSLLLDSLPNFRRQFSITFHAHRLALPFGDISLLEWRIASATREVLHMIYLFHEMARIVNDGSIALSAWRSKVLRVVNLAIGLAIVLVEIASSEGLVASETDEMLGMPNLAQCGD